MHDMTSSHGPSTARRLASSTPGVEVSPRRPVTPVARAHVAASDGYWLKRPLDILLAGLGLLLSAPLWLLFAVAIKLEDRGPVFYGQRRVGRNTRKFAILKFRTLVQNADQVVRPWQNPDRAMVTRVGSLLRRTALDELPQLWNILVGDMSFVGPRAMPVDEFERFRVTHPRLAERFDARPGLTGLAQVYGKATRDVRKKLRFDLLYIGRQSLWLDVKLVVLSFWITFRARWE